MAAGRLVAEGFLAHLWVWVVCTGFVLLNLFVISEAVDRNTDYAMRDYAIHFWHFIGLPCFSFVFCGILAGPIILHFQCRLDWSCMRADALYSSLKGSFLLCQGAIYVLFCTISFFAPFTDFREMELAERGIADTQAPGWAPINCMTDKNPGSIDVRTDLYSYFVLADPQWSVAYDKRTRVASEEGWSWVVAPILYNGPIEGCRTKYPLFVVCIDKSVSPTKCWWDNERRGAWTNIRLLRASHEIGEGERKKFWGKWVANPYGGSEKVKLHHENLFQFNTPSYDETIAFLEYKRNEYYTLKWKATVGWLAASVPIALVAFLVFVWLFTEHSQPSATEP
eukprot:Rhum_TRINITY_DN14391_c3_g1::Rhum_TRINITY_DN14391_c3_g1_i2::g.85633::m.85633